MDEEEDGEMVADPRPRVNPKPKARRRAAPKKRKETPYDEYFGSKDDQVDDEVEEAPVAKTSRAQSDDGTLPKTTT